MPRGMKRDVEPVIPRPQPRDLPVGPSRRSFATGEILRFAQDDQEEAGANDFDIALGIAGVPIANLYFRPI